MKHTLMFPLYLFLVSLTSLANTSEQACHYEELELLREGDLCETIIHRKAPIPGKEWECLERENQIEFKKNIIVISLGFNCACARQFERHKLAEAFFPFDWCKSQPESIYKAIENEFDDYLLLENLSIFDTNIKYREVLDSLYDVQFIHDFKVDGPPWHDYEKVKTKYYRRIARFLRALTLGKKVYFFRTIINKQDTIKLRELITKRFPTLDSTLVVLNNTPEFKENWVIPGIKNFFLEDPAVASYTSEANNQWDAVFKSLGLL